jgi:hypothetical protein
LQNKSFKSVEQMRGYTTRVAHNCQLGILEKSYWDVNGSGVFKRFGIVPRILVKHDPQANVDFVQRDLERTIVIDSRNV